MSQQAGKQALALPDGQLRQSGTPAARGRLAAEASSEGKAPGLGQEKCHHPEGQQQDDVHALPKPKQSCHRR